MFGMLVGPTVGLKDEYVEDAAETTMADGFASSSMEEEKERKMGRNISIRHQHILSGQ